MRVVIIVGAARSGTKILRDMLATATGVAAVPYDINYIWRLGNEGAIDDALPLSAAKTAKVRRIRHYLGQSAGANSALIEKTVATPLRLPFVNAIVPEAKYVFLVRDPADVVESAVRQWQAPPDWRYTLGKALTYPWLSAPGYASEQVVRTLARVTRRTAEPPAWGPVYPGMKSDLAARKPLVEICARQWEECNARALSGFGAIGKQPVFVSYAQLCRGPAAEFQRITDELGIPAVPMRSVERIDSSSVGAGERTLTEEQIHLVRRLTSTTFSQALALPSQGC